MLGLLLFMEDISKNPRVIRHRTEQSNQLLQFAQSERVIGNFNDVIIAAGDSKVFASRLVLSCYSNRFRSMFLSSIRQETFSLECCDKSLKQLVDYIYTGDISIDGHNVMNLLTTSDFLEIEDVKRYCFECLESALTANNCLKIFTMSILYGNQSSLQQKTYEAISDNFDQIFEAGSFKHLSKEDLIFLISRLNRLKVKETSLFKAIVKWSSHEDVRKEAFTTVFQCLDLHRLPPEFLTDVVSHENLVKQSSECLNMVVNCFTEKSSDERLKVTENLKLISIGGIRSKFVVKVHNLLGYHYKTGIYPDLYTNLSRHKSLKYNDGVYCIGGAVNGDLSKATDQVNCMNTQKTPLQWESVPSMN